MLHVHRAERADTLADALAGLLVEPLDDPFTAEIVSVPAKGVERWLSHRLSHRLGAADGRGDGVCAHVGFPSPAAVVGDVVGAVTGVDPADDPWAPSRAVWPLLEVIDGCAGEAWCAALGAHLGVRGSDEGGHRRGRRYATARRLVELFAAYAAHRPGMLAAWRDGSDDGAPPDLAWQPELWRRLAARIGASGPAERVQAAAAALRTDPALAPLPRRLSLFGPTRLPADHLAVLAALAEHRDVHLWLPHPSPGLWEAVAATGADGVPRRRDDPTAAVARHALLSSLGRDVRELQVRLRAAAPGAVEHRHRAPARPDTLLGRLQQDLHDDRPPDGTHVLADGDRSVVVHACHGPHRQVEVLREVVVGMLAADPTLEPRDVLVMCPDIETFAPLVTASFGLSPGDPEPGGDDATHPGHRMQVRLADRALRQVNPVLGTVGRLLELPAARHTASELLDLLGSAPVRHRFHLDEDDLERLRELAVGSGVRWGLDAAHRRPYRLDGFGQNTWAAGLDRMLLGVTMADDSGGEGGPAWLGTALPLDDVESRDVELVGRLAEFVDRLDGVLASLSRDQPLTAWVDALVAGLDALTATSATDAWQAAQARGELTAAARAAGPHAATVPLTLGDVRGLLAERLRGRPTRANFRTGTLTVATLVPMRSVPHRVVCLLGLDDGAFPRNTAVDGDDVLAREPLVGERDASSEDRQLLLDAVCAATEHLVVVHSGADERTGARRPPAVPLGELLDTITATAGPGALDRVVVRHPLQPFDPRNFTAGDLAAPGPFSFDRVELAGARAAVRERTPPPPFLAGRLAAPEVATVALHELVAFLEHPVKGFLRQRVGLSVFDGDDDPADALPVALDALQIWKVGDRLLRDRLAGRSLDACRHAEWRRGELPPGALGDALLATVVADVEPLVAAAEGVLGDDPTDRDVDVVLPGGARVVGTLGGLHRHPDGGHSLVRVEYSRLAAKQRVRAWARLLALTASRPDERWSAVTVGRGPRGGVSRATVGPVDPALAVTLLADLVDLHREGRRAPLPLPTGSAHVYARTRTGGASADEALEEAVRKWCGGMFPERDDASYVRAFGPDAGQEVLVREAGPPGGEPTWFGALALRVWEPLFGAEELTAS